VLAYYFGNYVGGNMTSFRRFDRELISRYDVAGPRYTSYPTAADFQSPFAHSDLVSAIQRGNIRQGPLSIYVHIPFCESLCFYCGCSKVVTRKRSRADEYLYYLAKEIAYYGNLFDSSRQVDQLHWGGGTPTFLSHAQMSMLMDLLREHFNFASDDIGEYSIEIDPRRVTPETIHYLRKIGFNRLSMGVQDFDLDVQQAINRVQPIEMTEQALLAAREAGFRSVSFDLIYGLPKQCVSTFKDTLDKVVALSPDRISLFNYAHMPHLIRAQLAINEEDLPSPETKLDLLELSRHVLQAAGFVSIGMDHFAKPQDELAKALANHQLHRNFQGYTTHKDHDMLGLGVTSISQVAGCYAQNNKTLENYYREVSRTGHATVRGILMSDEDIIRATVINDLSCERGVVFETFLNTFGVAFETYFDYEMGKLAPFIEDGLVSLSKTGIAVTEMGKILLRPICMVFDAYRQSDKQIRFSRVI
jgi:oxygen-independent coproporphyrinogen-3 oxidase